MACVKHPVLLFDLGGVLADFTGYDALYGLLQKRMSAEDIRAKWSRSPALRRFERGAVKPEAFALAFTAEWNLSLPPDEFLGAFSTWVRGLYDGAADLLKSLSGRYTLAVLSNTNQAHWTRLGGELGLRPLFDHVFLSYETGLCKPDREAYEHVIDTLGVAPAEIWFFDDNDANVEAAKACGMHAVRVRGIGELRKALKAIP